MLLECQTLALEILIAKVRDGINIVGNSQRRSRRCEESMLNPWREFMFAMTLGVDLSRLRVGEIKSTNLQSPYLS